MLLLARGHPQEGAALGRGGPLVQVAAVEVRAQRGHAEGHCPDRMRAIHQHCMAMLSQASRTPEVPHHLPVQRKRQHKKHHNTLRAQGSHRRCQKTAGRHLWLHWPGISCRAPSHRRILAGRRPHGR